MHDLFLVIHFIGLAMAVGTGFANLFLAAAAAKLEPAERGSFTAKTSVLIRMGHTGFGLLIVSGIFLMAPYVNTLAEMPALIIKLALVVAQIMLVTVISLLIRKAKKENDPSKLAKLKPWGMVIFLNGLTIVMFAVLSFH